MCVYVCIFLARSLAYSLKMGKQEADTNMNTHTCVCSSVYNFLPRMFSPCIELPVKYIANESNLCNAIHEMLFECSGKRNDITTCSLLEN